MEKVAVELNTRGVKLVHLTAFDVFLFFVSGILKVVAHN